MHKLLTCACKSQDFAQSQKKIARLHNLDTVTFRNSAGEKARKIRAPSWASPVHRLRQRLHNNTYNRLIQARQKVVSNEPP